MKTLSDLDVRHKRVLVRCDFNVPLSEAGDILDDFKIRQTIPTISYLTSNRVKVVLMSHLDDPAGRVVENLRLKGVAEKLSALLDLPVVRANACRGPEVENQTKQLVEGNILLLENLRFEAEEEKGGSTFAQDLARLGDVYVNDAFAVCHRDHASLKVAQLLPAGMGLLLEKEVRVLSQLRTNPAKPLVVILGGQAKGMETKARLINALAVSADFVLLGNLVADELERGNWKIDCPEKIILPTDSNQGRDIGPKTLHLFKEKIASARTIFWSGPLGQIEKEEFSQGSRAVAHAIVDSSAFSVAGGGQTHWFLNQLDLVQRFSHVSTGGDALLLFLSGDTLPGLDYLG